ncbi:MAG TPA: TetR/AcrR family transcriptional regulator [Solirubrobacteraceae bacterium]|nr:TetR/AcrR family transcriptional regulator [Solirubrobacteraceae bacterium]
MASFGEVPHLFLASVDDVPAASLDQTVVDRLPPRSDYPALVKVQLPRDQLHAGAAVLLELCEHLEHRFSRNVAVRVPASGTDVTNALNELGDQLISLCFTASTVTGLPRVKLLNMATRQLAPSRPRYRVSDDELLDAACAVFVADGFDRATMGKIADRAAITKPTLYSRFGSKAGLFEAAVQREYKMMLTRLSSAYRSSTDAEPFRAGLRRWVHAYFEFARERPLGFQLSIQGERRSTAANIIQRSRGEIISELSELIERTSGRQLGPGVRVAAAAIAGMTAWSAREAVSARVDLNNAADVCESMLYAAMRNLDLDLIAKIKRDTASTSSSIDAKK